MSDLNEVPPTAVSAKVKRLQSSGAYIPGSYSPGAYASNQEEAREARKAANLARAQAFKVGVRKNKTRILIALFVLAVWALVGTVQGISLNSSSPQAIVDLYISAMNSKEDSVFKNKKLFPKPAGVEILPKDLLSQVDTSLQGAKFTIKNTSKGAEAVITADNLETPIVLELMSSVQLNGVLLTQVWSVETKLPTVVFSAAEDLPATAEVSVGQTNLGNKSAEAFTAVVGKTYASPFGVMLVNTSATDSTDAASTPFPIVAGENKVAFGGGPINLTSLLDKALASGDFSVLEPMMSDSVDVLVGVGGATDFPNFNQQQLDSTGAIALLGTTFYGVSNWSTPDNPQYSSSFQIMKNFLAQQPEYFGSSSIARIGSSIGLYDIPWCSYIIVTPGPDGKIAKLFIARDFNSIG